MKRSRWTNIFICLALFFMTSAAVAEVVVGPGVVSPIDEHTNVNYHILAGTQITSPSLTGPPATLLHTEEAIEFAGGGHLQIDGGTFTGGNASFGGPSNAFVTVTAGTALDVFRSSADITTGTFHGGVAFSTVASGGAQGGAALVADLSDVTIRGGKFQGGNVIQPNAPIFPSNFPTVPDIVLLGSTLHLYGGQVSYIVIGTDSELDIYGTNFHLSPLSVTGKFANGALINMLVTDSSKVVLHDLVPEPGTLSLASICLAMCSRRRRTR